ncbi:hypothetical protein EYZ11_008547 [Aspergillus tanneri]|uniref:Allergen Asp f 4 n=1 Tax=Aspergillus tanneri TaxID=1220188 RepID=A0A4S3JFQ2_9EURO|nr:uncharacterized protein ATNIH1004_006066 [Aspergillus tanneri]KAA8647373.1 hypothetical protein ATNIH1004_006066 [Aspergillus tanneri]THC91991.1 hypothetical protein EYZ11_008547 [Aspergillus tanneri]
MQLKNSILLLTAVSAGSAVARLHGHERRHAHPVEKRAVGDIVRVEMGGKMVSWINEWSGAPATGAPAEPAPTPSESETGSTQVISVGTVPTDGSQSTTPKDGSCKNWYDSASQFTDEGFGKSTIDNNKEYVAYAGNVGSPWGSNIQEVSESNACNYRYVVAINGNEKDPWTLVFWNKIGPDGGINGWYSGNSALTLTIKPGETKYVAFAGDSQGSWGAAKGNKLPTDQFGGYACTWGEFDFGNSKNSRNLRDGETWSGWDVSAIQAMNAKLDVQGMKICQHGDRGCSSISNQAKNVVNAYTNAEAGMDEIGGTYKGKEGLRLQVQIDYE